MLFLEFLETIAKWRATVEDGLDSKIYSSSIIAYTFEFFKADAYNPW
jgi:hypothetical protein